MVKEIYSYGVYKQCYLDFPLRCRLNSLLLLLDPTLATTLISELFPTNASPLTSLEVLKLVSPFIVPSLVLSTPNLRNLEVCFKGTRSVENVHGILTLSYNIDSYRHIWR
jgi:hypothetical protein